MKTVSSTAILLNPSAPSFNDDNRSLSFPLLLISLIALISLSLREAVTNIRARNYSSLTANCALTPSKGEANCVISATQSDSTTNYATTTSGMTTSYSSDLQAVTIIAGLDKLSGGAVPSQTTASSTPAGSSGAKSTSQASSGAAGSATKSPNAAPAVTQQALLAGVAAVVGALVL